MKETLETDSFYNEQLIARTKMLRERKNWSQAEMATHLGTRLANYKKYETRTPLPHRFIPRFCALVGVSLEFFLMGLVPPAPERASKRRKH